LKQLRDLSIDSSTTIRPASATAPATASITIRSRSRLERLTTKVSSISSTMQPAN
jgi:hypothetical protein